MSVDTNPENIEHAKRTGLEAKLGDAVGVLSTLPPDRYDLVLALELIEHMPKPDGMTMVREIHRVLKPGGTLFLSTPNRWSLEGLAACYWGEKIRGWGKWEVWDPTHLHIYNAEEIICLVKSCGLVRERVVGYYYESTFPVIGRFRLPLRASAHRPLNRLGFNTILIYRKPGEVRL